MSIPGVRRADVRATDGSVSDRSSFRPDIEGLRAVAVLLVMGFHAGLPFVTGGFIGVDVFFVISGFLITGLLVREIEKSGRVSYANFYARRIRRLLPAGTVVLIFIAISSYVWLPAGLWGDVSGEIAAASVFVANWVFASKATDYFAASGTESPVQHFWSLSVEEQFYLFWPTLLVLFAGLLILKPLHLRRRLLIAMMVVLVPSLAYSWYLTGEAETRGLLRDHNAGVGTGVGGHRGREQ